MKAQMLALASVICVVLTPACKPKKKSENPPPAQQKQETPADQKPNNPAPVDANNGNQNPKPPAKDIKMVVKDAPNDNLEFFANQDIQIDLGLEGKDVGEGQYEYSLAQMPAGARLVNRVGNPSLVWRPAAEGEYKVEVLARNLDVCQQLLAEQKAACRIQESQFGNIKPDARFDHVQVFTFTVKAGVGSGNGYYFPGQNGKTGTTSCGQTYYRTSCNGGCGSSHYYK